MRLTERKPKRKKTRLTLGARYGQWTVIGLALPLVEVRCACGREQWIKIQVLRHDQSTQCRECRAAARRGHATHLANLKPTQIFQAMQNLSQLQMAYAAHLIRTRKFIEHQTLSREDVVQAVEMAALMSPAQIEAELTPKPLHVQARRTYTQYQSPKGGSL